MSLQRLKAGLSGVLWQMDLALAHLGLLLSAPHICPFPHPRPHHDDLNKQPDSIAEWDDTCASKTSLPGECPRPGSWPQSFPFFMMEPSLTVGSASPASETEVVNGWYQWKEPEAATYLGGLISDHPRLCGLRCDLHLECYLYCVSPIAAAAAHLARLPCCL